MGGAEDERLDGPLRAAERFGDVLVTEPVHAGEQHGRALLGREGGERLLEPLGQLASGRTRLRIDRGWIGELRPISPLVAIALRPEVDPPPPLGPAEIVQAEVGDDLVEPGRKACFGAVAVAEPEDLDEDVLDHFLRPCMATDESPGVGVHTGAMLAKELSEGRLVPPLHAEHEGHVGVRERCWGRRGICRGRCLRGPGSLAGALAHAGAFHGRQDCTGFAEAFPGDGQSTHRPHNTRGSAGFRAGDGAANPLGVRSSAPDPALARHLERINRYMRESGLLRVWPDRRPLREELARLLEESSARALDAWMRDVGGALGIPERDWPQLKADQAASVQRWARHIADPDDIETYVYLRRHARRGFISHFPASRFLVSQMRFVQHVTDEIRALLATDPERAEELVTLLNQEFMARVLHITDFFVEAREHDILAQEAAYRRAIEQAPAAILMADAREGRIFDANRIAERLLGHSRAALTGRLLTELHPPIERERADALWRQAVADGHANRDDLHIVSADGRPVPIFANAGFIEYGDRRWVQVMCVDLSERQRLESQLIQSEKMAAIGQLAAGIAHELRNPLAIVMNALWDLRQLVGDGNAEVSEDIHIAEEEITRAQAIIKNLLEFSRESGVDLEAVDINDLLTRTVQLLQRYLQSSGVRVAIDVADIPPCLANANAIRQILLNLITNAVQAMPDGGDLRLRTTRVDGTDRVRLEVHDTGVGIPAAHLQDVFNPFYTTKAPGQGTGLGLSVVHSIVRRYRGEIQLTSTVGEGTTFVIELPCQCAVSEEPSLGG